MKGKLRIIRVTSTTDYAITEYEDGRTDINGWTVDGVVDSWFHGQYPLYMSHATRDTHKVGYTEKVVKVEVTDKAHDLFAIKVRS